MTLHVHRELYKRTKMHSDVDTYRILLYLTELYIYIYEYE